MLILKCQWQEKNDAWLVFGNVRELQYRHVKKRDVDEIKEGIRYIGDWDVSKGRGVHIIVTFLDDKRQEIYSDNDCIVCNDKGQELEKIF